MNRLENKVAIITGGTNGLGFAAAKLFATEGCRVSILGRSASRGLEAENEINSQNNPAAPPAKFWSLDAKDTAEIPIVFEQIHQHFGKIDILVNSAGFTGTKSKIDECNEEDFDAVFDIDVRGLFFCIKYVIPYMRKNGGGSIVNLSSVCGSKVTSPTLAPYHAAKGAVNQITKHAAISYAPEKIRCNAVLPGTTLTPLIEKYAIENYGSLEAYEEFCSSFSPMGLGKPEDVANAILYLASDEAKHVTGVLLNVDGGVLAK